MVVCAFLFTLCNWRLSWYREQAQLASEIRKHAIHVEMQPGTPSWLAPFAQKESFASIKSVSFQNQKKLEDDDLQLFRKTPHLRVLSLHGTNLTNDGMKHLSGLEVLDTLSLKFTNISDDGLGHLSGLNNLVKLQLSDSKISGLGLKHLAGMRKLQHLELRNLEIIDEDLKHLEPLQDLRYLHLESRNLDGSGLASINKLKKLKTLLFRCYEFDTVVLRD
jgi:hypothetical protein